MYFYNHHPPADMCVHCDRAKLMLDGWLVGYLAPLDCRHETFKMRMEREAREAA